MKVGDLVKHTRRGINGIVVIMPPSNERYGAVQVQWFDLMTLEWCAKHKLKVVSEKV